MKKKLRGVFPKCGEFIFVNFEILTDNYARVSTISVGVPIDLASGSSLSNLILWVFKLKTNSLFYPCLILSMKVPSSYFRFFFF